MNMPGFTAEVSLYKTNEQYHETVGAALASGGIYPAQSVFLDRPEVLGGITVPTPSEIFCRPLLGWCLDKTQWELKLCLLGVRC
jgi:hypothetical protein